MKNIALRGFEFEIKVVFEFFTAKVTNPSYYEEIKADCQDSDLLNRIHNHKVNLNLGLLTKDDFWHFAIKKEKIKDLNLAVFDNIIDVLVDYMVIAKMEPNTINNTHALFCVTTNKAQYYYDNIQILFNGLFGFDYIVEKYISSIVKIENCKEGNLDIGNGFLVDFGAVMLVVTNKHVVSDAKKLIVKNYQEEEMQVIRILVDDSNDLAFLVLSYFSESAIPFILNTEGKILDTILTIGYPPIPTTKKSYALAHLGEVNSFVEDYWGQALFIFSAKTNPGNSGSPVIDKDGRIVGIVSEQLEEQDWYKKSKIPYHAAIPSIKILEFFNKKYPLIHRVLKDT